MERVSVIKVDSNGIEFEEGYSLTSYHQSDCCESHYLSFDDLTLEDFKDLEFNLSNDSFFRRVEGYGIELIPINGWAVRIPGYGSNNGYYSSDLELILSNGKETREYNISECQDISY